MKFKYLSLCLCLSLFACSDDENILPEEKPAVPQGEPMEDTPIVQKKIIFLIPACGWALLLANDGFVVEVEMGAESLHAAQKELKNLLNITTWEFTNLRFLRLRLLNGDIPC